MFRLAGIGGAVYVDADWTDFENGTLRFPYNTLSEGVAAVPPSGKLWMEGGKYIGIDNVPIKIEKAMTIRSYDGTAMIGE